jgi:hypothetical protein
VDEVESFEGFFTLDPLGMAGAQLTPHIPAHPEQQDAASQQRARDLQELGYCGSKPVAQDRGRNDTDQDRSGALLLG